MLNKNSILYILFKNKGLLILLLPGALLFLIFNYLPMAGIIIAFKNIYYNKGILGSPWVGFENFRILFNQDAFQITKNTIIYNAYFIISNTVLSIILAIMLYELSKKAVKLYQTVLFLPYFISWVVATYILFIFLSSEMGVFNKILTQIGLEPVDWYTTTEPWPAIFIIANIWKNVGYNTILYYTACIGIDPSYYEAAAIDGATKLQQIRQVTLPLISPLIIMLTLLGIGKIFYSDFGIFYFLTNNSGPLYPVSNVIDTYVYRALMSTGDIGIAAAAGLYQSAVGFILVLASNMLVKRYNSDYTIF